MQNVKNTIVDKMLALVAPHLCCGCGEIGENLCSSCRYDIITEHYTACMECGRPEVTGMCSNHDTHVQRVWIVGERRGVLQRLIGSFKFQNMKSAARPLADLLAACLSQLPQNAVLVPIPTASRHIHERGYDHLDLITRHLSMKTQIPIIRVLRRVDGATQHHANREQRFEQVKSAFAVDTHIDPRHTYILVDDVITTGATVYRAADLLYEAGAQTIWVAAIARQPSTDPLSSVKITN